MLVQLKPRLINSIENRPLRCYGHVKLVTDERFQRIITNWYRWKEIRSRRRRRIWRERVNTAVEAELLQIGKWTDRDE
jgi:hypothetical protein